MITSIYKSYRRRKQKDKANGGSVFKKNVVMLDDHYHLFKLDETGTVKLKHKAKLKGVSVVFVNPLTLPLCPICGSQKPEWAQGFSL